MLLVIPTVILIFMLVILNVVKDLPVPDQWAGIVALEPPLRLPSFQVGPVK